MEMSGHKEKKHPCKDCFYCQWCSDERCKLCRRDTTPCNKEHTGQDSDQTLKKGNTNAC